MFRIVSECNQNEVWGNGFFSIEKAQERIDTGYIKQYMYSSDKHKKLIVVSY